MSELLAAVAAAFGIVFVAELGDKSQLLAVGFGSRHPPRRVMVGLAVGYGAANLVAVVVGGLLGARLPERPIAIAGGVVFIVFGVLALRGDEDDEAQPPTLVRSSVTATIALAIVVAEVGDKTQIATATLATRSHLLGTWIGATAGELTIGAVGVLAGSLAGSRIPAMAIRRISALFFVSFGVAMLVSST